MKPIDSSARTLGLIGFSILVHGAAFWTLNENLSLKQVAQIIEETRAQANKSDVWEKISGQSREVEVELAAATASEKAVAQDQEEPVKALEIKAETKSKVKAKTDKKAKKIAKSSEAAKAEIATVLPEKEVLQEDTSSSTSLPKTTVNVTEETPWSEPENLEPDIQLIPVSQKIAGVEAESAGVETDEVQIEADDATEANVKIEKTPRELEETDLLSELQASEQSQAEVATETASELAQAEEVRSYLKLKQENGNRPPQYPLEARRQGLQGRVILKYFVNESGRVENVKVAESSGHKILDDEAVRAVSNYKYSPGQSGWTEHPVRFSLNGLKGDVPAELGASNTAQ